MLGEVKLRHTTALGFSFVLGLAVSHLLGPIDVERGVSWLLPAVVSLFLVDLNFAKMRRTIGALLPLYGLATVATLVGGVVAVPLANSMHIDPRIVPALTATYTGGTVNLLAVADAVQLRNQQLLSMSIAADLVVTTIYVGGCWLLLHFACRRKPAGEQHPRAQRHNEEAKIRHYWAAALLGLVFSVMHFGVVYVTSSKWAGLVMITVVAVAISQRKLLPCPIECATRGVAAASLCALLFLLGASVSVGGPYSGSTEVLSLAGVIVGIHCAICGAAFCFVERLRINGIEVVVASAACIGGAGAAAFVAIASNRRDLAVPGVALGGVGYLVGNVNGLLASQFLRLF